MGHGAGMPLAFLGKIWDWGLATSFPKRAGSVRPAPAQDRNPPFAPERRNPLTRLHLRRVGHGWWQAFEACLCVVGPSHTAPRAPTAAQQHSTAPQQHSTEPLLRSLERRGG